MPLIHLFSGARLQLKKGVMTPYICSPFPKRPLTPQPPTVSYHSPPKPFHPAIISNQRATAETIASLNLSPLSPLHKLFYFKINSPSLHEQANVQGTRKESVLVRTVATNMAYILNTLILHKKT